jgi:scyllo-inositol 2-dehydrogenase (NAD+)
MDRSLIRAATVGCGRMGAFPSDSSKWLPSNWHPIAHLDSLKCNDSILIVGAVETSNIIRKKVRDFYSIQTYKNIDSLLKQNQLDLITVATRTPAKLEIIKSAYDRGVRLFHIEKPLCNSMDELEQFEKILSNCSVTYGCLRRYVTPFTNITKYASNNNLGKLQLIQVCMGKSMLYWTHTHAIDYLLMQIKSPPKSVQAIFDNIDLSSDGTTVNNDPTIKSATIYFENGEVGLVSSVPGNSFIHVYEHGVITIKNDGKSVVLGRKIGGDPYPTETLLDITQIEHGSTGNAISLLANAYLIGGEYKKQVDSARDAAFLGQRIMFAMVESHIHDGKNVSIDRLNKAYTLKGLFNGVPA